MDSVRQYLYQLSRENFMDEDVNWLIRETLIQIQDEFYLSAYGFLRLNFPMLSSVSNFVQILDEFIVKILNDNAGNVSNPLSMVRHTCSSKCFTFAARECSK